ncbi:MAG: indole-3-glycerol-phosphate synthase [Candidatus Acetothermia bacterium]
MNDVLDELANSARDRIKSGYYEPKGTDADGNPRRSFVEEIGGRTLNPVIAELKPESPSRGSLFEGKFKPKELARLYLDGGAAGFSVLTDPDHFGGSTHNLEEVSDLGAPTLMKDFIMDYSQIRRAREAGADAVLLIYRLFKRGQTFLELEEAIEHAKQLELEVLLEVNDLEEYKSSLETEAEMIGINNRDLRSLEVTLSTTAEILAEADKDRIVWSMSGISAGEDVDFLRRAGADAFLVGTSLSRAGNPAEHLKRLVGVING